MLKSRLTQRDWEEIVCALESKLRRIENGNYDLVAREAFRPSSETWRWASHLRGIIAKIEIGEE